MGLTIRRAFERDFICEELQGSGTRAHLLVCIDAPIRKVKDWLDAKGIAQEGLVCIDAPICKVKDWLDAKGIAQEGRGAPDAASPAQEFERIDKEIGA